MSFDDVHDTVCRLLAVTNKNTAARRLKTLNANDSRFGGNVADPIAKVQVVHTSESFKDVEVQMEHSPEYVRLFEH
jgi:hypothetical protein